MKFALTLFLGFCSAIAIHAQTVSLQELYGFNCTSSGCADGKEPDALIQASDGNFYGVAEYSTTATSVAGGGTIFKMAAAGQVTVLYTFPENPSTGSLRSRP